ncbi:MAG: NAD(P)/FAD-dependent oxidoreductase [Candidatus Levybacteria bacterium]|nr:NAD(P)/FAD-dependent oxidoreductase [Candidatus Levybacteria bacterium]
MEDLLIIGAGPAGLAASIYASCFHLKHHVIGSSIGGQMLLAPDIINYPGFVEISGKELTERMVAQGKARGGQIVEDSVVSLKKDGDHFTIQTNSKVTYSAQAIIIATGTERKKLNVPGEKEYTGRGVHYCATCGRQDYANKVVVVVGGANAAAQSALQLAQAATKVFICYRGPKLRCDPEWITQITRHPNIEIIYNTVVKEVMGDGTRITSIKVLQNNTEQMIPVEKVFVEIGGVPGTALVMPLGVELDAGGFIRVNERLETTVPGVFAAGDLVSYGLSIEQITTAVGLGARAAASAFAYLKKTKAPSLWGQTLTSM